MRFRSFSSTKPLTPLEILQAALGLFLIAIVWVLIFPGDDAPNGDARGERGASDSSAPKWFEGGTLHKATLGEWRSATYANRLATSSDFCVRLLQPKRVESMDQLKAIAKIMEQNISDVAGNDSKLNSLSVAEAAAGCWILMKSDL